MTPARHDAVRGLVAAAAVALTLGVTGVGAATAGVAGPASVSEVGWWSQNPAAQAADGGFVIETTPAGAVSVAALRLSTTASLSTLTVALEPGTGSVGTAALQACTTADQWTPADPGAYADAPEADCSAAVDFTTVDGRLVADLSGKTWTTVMVVATGTAPFRAVVASAAADGTAAPVAPPTTAPPAPATPTPNLTPVPSPAATPPYSQTFDPGPTSLTESPPPATEGAVGAPPEPAPTDASTTGDIAAPTFEDTAAGSARPWGRLGLILPLSALAGAAAAYGTRARRLGTLALPALAGRV